MVSAGRGRSCRPGRHCAVGVVGQRHEPREGGVCPPQQATQVVVLTEEGVEAAGHGHLGTVGQAGAPTGETAAERSFPFIESHPCSAFRQQGCRSETGDSAADHRDARRILALEAGPSRRGHEDTRLAVAAPPDTTVVVGAHRAYSVTGAEPLRARKV